MNYYPFNLGDYAAHTAHLEPMEDLAYRRMLDLYYRTEQPLPADWRVVARLIRMKDFGEAIEAVLSEFFELTDAGWTHGRCEAEIAKMQDKQAKAKASAQASVNARSANAQRTLSGRSAKVELPTPTPIPTPKESVENFDGVAGVPPGTGEFELDDDPTAGHTPTLYGGISRAIRQAGIGNANPHGQRFRLLVDAGATSDEFLQFVPKALGISGDRFAYVLGCVEGERKRSASMAGQLRQGAPMAPQSVFQAERAAEVAKWLKPSRPTGDFIDMEASHAPQIR